jgi:hypothetical protein
MIKNNSFSPNPTKDLSKNLNNQNPFLAEEPLNVWFESDNFYQKSKKTSLRQFKQNEKISTNIFMSLKLSYLKIVNLITKHAVIATLLMVLALTSVSASAAQLIAPTEYKPTTLASNLFTSNKQKEVNPYTALKPDENNDVVSSEKCNLTIKYPKYFDQKPLSVDQNNYDVNSNSEGDYLYIRPDQNPDQKWIYYSTPSIACYANKPDGLDPNPEKSPDNPNMASYGKERKDLGKDFVAKEFGWFINQVTDLQFRIYENTALPNQYTIYFTFENKHYLVVVSTQDGKADPAIGQDIIKALKGNQIQLQFNSLVKNEANKEILNKPKTENLGNSSSVNSTNSKVSDNAQNQETKAENKELFIIRSAKTGGFELYETQTCSQNNVSCNIYYLKSKDLPSNLIKDNILLTNKIKVSGTHKKLSNAKEYEFVKITKIDNANLKSATKIEDKSFFFTSPAQNGSVYLAETKKCIWNSGIDSSCKIYSISPEESSKLSQIKLLVDKESPTIPIGNAKISGTLREVIPNPNAENLGTSINYFITEITKVEEIKTQFQNQTNLGEEEIKGEVFSFSYADGFLGYSTFWSRDKCSGNCDVYASKTDFRTNKDIETYNQYIPKDQNDCSMCVKYKVWGKIKTNQKNLSEFIRIDRAEKVK